MEYDSDDVDYYSSSRECFHINGGIPTDDAPELAPPDLSHPRSCGGYHRKKAVHRRPSWRMLAPPRLSSRGKGRSLRGRRRRGLTTTF